MLSLWTWCVLVVAAVFGFLAVAGVAMATLPFDKNRTLAGRTFRWVARRAIGCVPLWRFAARPPYPQRLTRAHVVVSNHESHLDAFLISHLPWEMKWLAKRSLFSLPFIGWSMALAGDIAIVRGAPGASSVALAHCEAYLRRGMSVFLFPEGTRAADDALAPFKPGAFRLALATGCPIMPLALAGTRQGLAKGSFLFGRCHATVRVGTPIETAALLERHRRSDGSHDGRAAVADLEAQTRAQIIAMRSELREALASRAS